jgi:hypothetical protein
MTDESRAGYRDNDHRAENAVIDYTENPSRETALAA